VNRYLGENQVALIPSQQSQSDNQLVKTERMALAIPVASKLEDFTRSRAQQRPPSLASSQKARCAPTIWAAETQRLT